MSGFPGTGARIVISMILAAALGLSGCAGDLEVKVTEYPASEVEAALDRARSSADELGLGLMAALGEQTASGGPVAAISVCSEIAPAAASEISRDGVEIRRTSVRYRNPENAPDDWEQAWLGRFEESLAAGELPKDVHEIDTVVGELRYLRPIVVAPQCLQCHGAQDQLDPQVREQLARRYPGDKATGFSAGDLRGAFSVRVGMDARDSG